MSDAAPVRRLCVVLGDQLDADSALFDGFDPARDAILMTEAAEEATYVPQHRKRLVLFFAAMRHFAEAQRAEGRRVLYRRLDDGAPQTLADSLRAAVDEHAPERVEVVLPGDWRVLEALKAAAPEIVIREDRHFLTTPEQWADMRRDRRRFILEDFYRAQRRRTGWLMEDGEPLGGEWNFDKANRRSFGRDGPGLVPRRPHSAPDDVTNDVIRMVEKRFPDAPGSTQGFAEPVTRRQALVHLRAFVEDRLPLYGDYQDAIAQGQPTLWHARISAAMNLKLISPREACEAAMEAHRAGRAPLNAVEGFVRQILGWREFTRGVYWTLMPDYAGRNELGADADLPAFFWTGETEMACLRDSVGQVLREGYAHHIQRLMVMGLFLMLWGARPKAAHDWHMGMYLDAVDWVSLPNMAGMSQHADGGVMGTKPYCASGAYIDRMSDCCSGCRYDPKQATGEKACPFTTLYWDFLDRHESRFRSNMRMKMQLSNLRRKSDADRRAIRKAAEGVRGRPG
ncbi:cryptochrome/photolyase family protein [Rubrimonas cliftonensis]|uniref:Deoxyribodipyrimidine photolyase-related protein n=1 Tax=Rubrimonas cliftonensis TaxID=89524 RepID=A0A1H3VF79_9RHOB|nr:cryptochrome/photolyase family protein [Rubrimonas cliftonensis]SDZ73321.1 deoxyribodipyrimidine photolyase-related protein [Rubrimonas cliftonensis]